MSQGIALRLLATALFACMSASVHLAAQQAPVGQVVFWRSAVALVPIVLYLGWRGELPRGLRTRRPFGHLHRSLLGATAMVFSFVSLAQLPVAQATALAYLTPLVSVAAAVLLLDERPSPIVAVGVALGLLGIGLMLAPALGAPTLDRAAIVGIAAGLAMAVTTALARVQIKELTRTEPAGAIAFYFALACTVVGLLSWPLGWIAPDRTTLLALTASGLFGGLAHIAMTEAVARAPISVLAPFEYTGMLWALGFDLVLFAHRPEPLGLVGAGTIVAAAAVVAWRPSAAQVQAHPS